MRKVFISILAVVIIFGSVLTSEAAAKKKKIAVLDFEFATIRDRWWPGDWNLGKGISDMVVTQLVKDGTFSVIERNKLDKVLSEQKLGASGLVDASTAAQIGKILGVQAVITGSVTQFSIDTEQFGIGGIGKLFGGAGVGVSTTTAKVFIDARLIDTTTAEIVAVAEGKGEESKKGLKLAAGGNKGFGGIKFGGTGFDDTILGTATRQSVGDVVKQLAGKGDGSAVEGGAIRAKVAYAGDGTVIVDAGSKQGITVGQTLYIVKVKKEIKSPSTGEVIKRLVDTIAEIKVTEVDASSATGTIIKGNIKDIKEGDDVSSTPSL
ncbi:MAG: curli production assembly protein CsgG [Nitrospirae bacterium]|nr:curli production assembly protein CsgG [Nitrospirota bacterium]